MTIRPMFLPVHDRQHFHAEDRHPQTPALYCYDYKARLRWRITHHRGHGGFYVLKPKWGVLHLDGATMLTEIW